MGEVYRARDPRLGREVAIKALPAEVAQDPERRARFEREAQLLASLNHPNIAAIHGLEEAGGAKYLVLEMVEGRTLGEVLAEGPLPPDEAAAIALQIAEALAAAHEKGIIHRDLKPGNVMVTAEHKVKVLDFGLGKALDSDAGRSLDPGATPAQSPTMTIAATQAGLILGTAAYMSPEQAKGRPADRRSDVWGFGCLLYEMLAGKPAFEGEDATEILAHVVRGEPNWEALPGTVPASLRTLTERCLIKDRSKRLSDMSVVRFVLEERRSMSAAAPSGPAAAPTTRWGLIAGLVMAAVILTAGITRYYSGTPATGPGGITRLSVVLPFGDEVEMVQHKPVAIAPDGTSIVYVAGGDGDVPRLYRRTLDRARTEPIPDTEGARAPFFSPDGRWVAFFAGGKLKKVTVEGTGAQVIADAPDSRGGFWAGDDTIYFAPIPNAALMKVRASGGTVETATTLDRAHGEVSHRWPFVTNDGKVLLYSVWTGPGVDEHEIIRQPLPTGERSVLLKGGDDAAYVEPGFLVYGRNDKLLAVAWKPGQDGLEAAAPFTLAETPRLDGEGSSAYAVSRTGTLAYLPGGSQRLARRIVWVDRSGREEPLAVPERDYESVAISPDGTQAAVQIEEGTVGVWTYDFARRTLTPFETSSSYSSQAPLWSADGSTIYYRGTRKGQRNLYAKSTDAASGEVRLVPKDDVTQTPTSVSADGRWLLYNQMGGVGQRVLQIWALRLDGDKSERKVAEGEDSNGQLSPDGKWLAFESTRSGRLEVYVTPFPGPGASRQISIGGGSGARWSRDGRELFYRGTASFFAVDMGGGGSAPGTPRALYPEIYRGSPNGNSAYDVAPDGSRFLRIRQAQPEGPLNHIDVVLNWATQLGK
jgi:serine/threonine-protein kinase